MLETKFDLKVYKGLQSLSSHQVLANQRVLSLSPLVRNLFPDEGLKRGSTVVVSGSTSLALLTIAAASAEGSWCVALNMADLGIDAAVEAGVSLDRLALVPNPGKQWAIVASTLAEAVDVVLVRPPEQVKESDARRLVAKARECGSVLIPVVEHSSQWPLGDLRLHCNGFSFSGLNEGHGYLQRPRLMVNVEGRNKASMQRQAIIGIAS